MNRMLALLALVIGFVYLVATWFRRPWVRPDLILVGEPRRLHVFWCEHDFGKVCSCPPGWG